MDDKMSRIWNFDNTSEKYIFLISYSLIEMRCILYERLSNNGLWQLLWAKHIFTFYDIKKTLMKSLSHLSSF